MFQSKVLVSDFDGTMTKYDFYKLAIDLLIPPDTPDFWAEYRAGSITHYEALRRYFGSIDADEERVLAVVNSMELDSELAVAIGRLNQAGWRVVVASAGCQWYIRHLLVKAGVSVEVHANPGQFEAGRGLLMEMPHESTFYSPTLGINKVGIVQHYLNEGRTVAFAGDGFPDADPARLVTQELRFARGDLANVLTEDGLMFHRFNTWADIAKTLLNGLG